MTNSRPCGEGNMTDEEILALIAQNAELNQAILQADMYGGLLSGAAAGLIGTLMGPVGLGGGIIIGAIASGGSGVCSMIASQAESSGGDPISGGWGVGWNGEGNCH